MSEIIEPFFWCFCTGQEFIDAGVWNNFHLFQYFWFSLICQAGKYMVNGNSFTDSGSPGC